MFNNHTKIENVTLKLIDSWNIFKKNVCARFDEYMEKHNIFNKFMGKIF